MLWEEAIHTYKRVRNSMDTTGIASIPFKKLYGEKPKIIGSLSEFGRIGYFTKREKSKKKMTDKHSSQSWLGMWTIIHWKRTGCITLIPRG